MPSGNVDTTSDLPQLTLVYGQASAMRERIVDELVARALPEDEREWGLVTLDADDAGPEGIVSQVNSGSLMADSRVVLVRAVDKLSNSAQKTLAKGLQTIPPATCVILDAQSSSDYKRKGAPVAADLRKVCEQLGNIIEASVPSDRELPGWVCAETEARGKTMSPAVARMFLETLGGNVEMVLNELEKLVDYVGPEHDEVSAVDVREIVSGEQENNVFDLVDAIGRRDAQTALSVIPSLLPSSGGHGAAMPILAMISRQLRLVWQARALAANRLSAESRKSLPPEWEDKLPSQHNFFDATSGRRFLVRKYAEQARNFSDVQLVRAFVKVYETDLALKGQGPERMDDRLALETLVVSLCRL